MASTCDLSLFCIIPYHLNGAAIKDQFLEIHFTSIKFRKVSPCSNSNGFREQVNNTQPSHICWRNPHAPVGSDGNSTEKTSVSPVFFTPQLGRATFPMEVREMGEQIGCSPGDVQQTDLDGVFVVLSQLPSAALPKVSDVSIFFN